MVNKVFDFCGKFKFFFAVSVLIVVVGIICSFIIKPELDINFKGGTTITYSYEGKIDTDAVLKDAQDALDSVSATTQITYSFSGDLEMSQIAAAAENAVSEYAYDAQLDPKDDTVFILTVSGSDYIADEDISKIEEELVNSYADNNIQYVLATDLETEEILLTISESQDYTSQTTSFVITVAGNTALSNLQLDTIDTKLIDTYQDNNVERTGVQAVGASVGASFFGKSLYALGLASVLVIIYVGIRFRNIGGVSAALTALFALVHDVAITYFINVIFGITIDANFIAVVLTILGYSLNDTIVIYDRVRENTALLGATRSTREIVNLSITQSFKRTTVTSLTTFVAIMSVTIVAAIAGLDSILTFAIPMSVGIVSGMYSSTFLAGPLYTFWAEFKAKKGLGGKKKEKKADYAKKKKKNKKVYY